MVGSAISSLPVSEIPSGSLCSSDSGSISSGSSDSTSSSEVNSVALCSALSALSTDFSICWAILSLSSWVYSVPSSLIGAIISSASSLISRKACLPSFPSSRFLW